MAVIKQKPYATGRRKTSVARVFINTKGTGKITINKREIEKYFPEIYWAVVRAPMTLTELTGKFDVVCTVKGGGLTGQAEAIRHGLARVIDKMDKEKYHKLMKILLSILLDKLLLGWKSGRIRNISLAWDFQKILQKLHYVAYHGRLLKN